MTDNHLACLMIAYVNDSSETKGVPLVLKNQAEVLLPLSQKLAGFETSISRRTSVPSESSKINTTLYSSLG